MQLTVVECTNIVADMASDNLGAMKLAGSSNVEYTTHEMDDCQNDAVVTFTKHTGIVSLSIAYNCLSSCLQLLKLLLLTHLFVISDDCSGLLNLSLSAVSQSVQLQMIFCH